MSDMTGFFTLVGACVTAIVIVILIGYALGVIRISGEVKRDDE